MNNQGTEEIPLGYTSWSPNAESKGMRTEKIGLFVDGYDEDDDEDQNLERDGMTSQRMLAYSIGHFSNDLFASMWFIY